ncbi:MAG: DNA gyrase inhibitor YacG [Nitrospirae bacterium]|nr:DNA gyrase inhibitor YacG [Nitrospirota bacterium]MBF0540592.1 DNA gyrase inhibitor YacG [Nitrospirota bacterium]
MKVKCPTCKKSVEWEGNDFRPFCSERCKTNDLALWAEEKYVVSEEIDEELDVDGLSERIN